MKLTSNLEEISVFERRSDQFSMDNRNIRVVIAALQGIDPVNKTLLLSTSTSSDTSTETHAGSGPVHQTLPYSQVCICTGSQPRSLFPHYSHSHVLTIRDLDSVKDMTRRLATARKVVIVGNGGIAMELANALTFCDVVWVVKDNYIGSAFFDATASAFIAPALLARARKEEDDIVHDEQQQQDKCKSVGNSDADDGDGQSIDPKKRRKLGDRGDERPAQEEQQQLPRQQGSALGPEWIGKSSFLSNLPPRFVMCEGH